MTELVFPKHYENLYNNLIKELKRFYRKNNMTEPARKDMVIYFEELKYIQRLNLNFTGFIGMVINGTPFVKYLTNLRKVNIGPSFTFGDDVLNNIFHKDAITEISIDGTGIQSLDLSEFPNLKSLTITNNNDLEEIKGIGNLRNLEDITIYENPLLNENQACQLIVQSMQNKATVQADILYYKKITSLIRKEYSQYRDSFKSAEWIERIYAGVKDHTTIKHSTESTGLFYSKLNDILDRIMPRSGVDDLEAIYIIYSWIINNVSYDHKALNSKLKMHSSKVTLNFDGKPQTINMAFGSIGGTNGAFNALYQKSVVCQGYTRFFQMLLKCYDPDLKTIDEASYCNTDPNALIEPLTKNFISSIKAANHSIIRIILDDNEYFCDATNERSTKQYGLAKQERFMKTYDELTTSFFPLNRNFRKGCKPLTDSERNNLLRVRIANNKPYSPELKTVRIMEKMELHLTDDSENLNIEASIKKEQAKDLLLLGVINEDVLRIIEDTITAEYAEIRKKGKANKSA